MEELSASKMESLLARVHEYSPKSQLKEIGVVTYVGDGIATIFGLDHAMYGEMVVFENGSVGMIQNLLVDQVGAIIFGDYHDIHEEDLVTRLYRVMDVPVGDQFLGRVVNPLGEAIDGGPAIQVNERRPVEAEAPAIMDRKSVTRPLQTGIKAIDALIPIGRGQRELIIGDRKTGKTTIGIDTILNQADQDVVCIYVAIGQKQSTVKNIVNTLQKHGAMKYTIVMSAAASYPSSLLYLAPYAATAMGEYFMYKGRDVLIVYDDLSKQAAAYREMSLLLKRPPGREAYPGDVFYLHSRLLERSAQLRDELGGGSITSLPIVETQAGDISAYIPTNVISITDGQIYLETDLFNSGVRPAINAGLSVSRVGGSAQLKGMKKVAGTLRIDLASYRELEAFSQFGSDLDSMTQDNLMRGARTVELLKQPAHCPMPVADQVIILYALQNGYLKNIPVNNVLDYQDQLIAYCYAHDNEAMIQLQETGQVFDVDKLNQLIQQFTKQYEAGAEFVDTSLKG